MHRTAALLAITTSLLASACSDGGTTAASVPTPDRRTLTPIPTVELTPEPVEARVQARLPLAGGPDYIGIGRDSVWVKLDSGTVVRLDPTSTRATATIPVATGLCQGLGVSEDEIWVCTEDGIARVDPATNRVTTRVTVAKSKDQGPLPIGLGHVWLISAAGDALIGVSSATREVAVEVPLGTRCADATVTGDAVWVACFGDGTARRVDPVTRRVTATVSGLPDARRISSTSNSVWVGYAEGLAHLDARTGAVRGIADAAPGATGSLHATTDRVWVRSAARFLRSVDAHSLAVTASITAPERSSGSVAVGFGSVWTTAYDDEVLYRLRL